MVSERLIQTCDFWTRARFALAASPHRDDAIPQWGSFRGADSVFLLGINPGGDSSVPRSCTDARLLPVWENFQRDPTVENFVQAQQVYTEELQRTKYWAQHVAPVLEALAVRSDDVTLCNCIPFRTPDTKWSAATRRAAAGYIRDVLETIRPSCLVAMGKLAADVAQDAGRHPDFVWNRGWGTAQNNSERASTLRCMREYHSRL
jgi:hypothetical protein